MSGFTLPDGRRVESHRLENKAGASVEFLTLGGAITAINMPDRDGNFENIVLGYGDLQAYDSCKCYFGAIIGRYANRIGAGRFTLDGHSYQLPVNDGPNTLHGGPQGFHRQLWQVERRREPGADIAILRYHSPDGEGGFPGALDVQVTYRLDEQNILRIDYQAVTRKTTVLNLTNHSYFNLDGNGAPDILDQQLEIDAAFYTPTDANCLPTGDIAPVAGTPMDFQQTHIIGARIHDSFAQLLLGKGYDHNWIINNPASLTPRFALRASSPRTGRSLTLRTTQPGVQFYTGNNLDGTVMGSCGHVYQRFAGFAFETQNFPDAPNQPGFPSSILHPGETYRATTIYGFNIKT